MIVREIEVSDAEGLSCLTQQVEASSAYMLWEAGERESTIEQQKKMIDDVKTSRNSMIFVAENKNKELVGYLFAIGGKANRNRHSVYIVIGILKDFQGQGIGRKLFIALEKWALTQAVHRLELTVVTKNQAGVKLYQKMGFEIEGTKRNSLFINHEFVDEYYMSKMINLNV